jgi:hypothetical protein
MRFPSVVLAVLLLPVAGCVGAPAVGPSSAPTVSGFPDELPDDCRIATIPETAENSTASSESPTGLSAGGVESPRRVAVGHHRTLSESTFTFYRDWQYIGDPSARCAQVNTRTGEFYEVRIETRRAERVELYSDGETVYRRVVYRNGSVSTTRTPAVESSISAVGYTRRSTLHGRLTDVDGSLAAVGVADGVGGRHYRTASAGNVTVDGETEVTYTSFALDVREDGVVRRLDYAYRIGNMTNTIDVRERFGAVGVTDVERPEWVPSE